MPCPFTVAKIFCAGPNFLSQPKNLNSFSASSKTFVTAYKPILQNANHLFVWQKMFVTATICKSIFVLAQNIWTSPKHFGTYRRTSQKWLKIAVFFVYTAKLGDKELFGHPEIVFYPYELKWQISWGKWFLITICSLSPSLTIICYKKYFLNGNHI